MEKVIHANPDADATSAINDAIGKVAKRGGGTVFLPPGKYRCGTLHMRSDVSLHIGPGALLEGAPDAGAYARDCLRRKTGNPEAKHAEGALLYGENVHNVAIFGEGTIDGNGAAFWTPSAGSHYLPADSRPHAIVQFVNSSRIRLGDLELRNAPCYTVWLLGCESVRMSGLRLRNPMHGPNTDGLDIDCCSRVTIRDCDIAVGDDCIALKSDTWRLGRNAACADITVDNCVLSSPTCGVRIGYEGDGEIRNACFSNLAMTRVRHGIDILSIVTRPPFTDMVHGATIHNMVFSNITLHAAQKAFYLWQGAGTDFTNADLKGGISDLLFSNIVADVSNGSYLGGVPENPVRNVSFEHVRCRFNAAAPAPTPQPPGVFGGSARFAHAYTLRHAENITFHASSNHFGDWPGWQGDFDEGNHNASISIASHRTRNNGVLENGMVGSKRLRHPWIQA